MSMLVNFTVNEVELLCSTTEFTVHKQKLLWLYTILLDSFSVNIGWTPRSVYLINNKIRQHKG